MATEKIMEPLKLTDVILLAGALGLTATGIVEASKAYAGGIGVVGFNSITRALRPFESALEIADKDWAGALLANFINRIPLQEQKAAARTLIHLGMTADNAAQIAVAGHIDAAELKAILAAKAEGLPLTPPQTISLDRLDGFINVALDGGYAKAEQRNRSVIFLISCATAVLISCLVGALFAAYTESGLHSFSISSYVAGPQFGIALLIGYAAVPLIPGAMGVTNLVRAATAALKSKAASDA